jgi:hypothetical protein
LFDEKFPVEQGQLIGYAGNSGSSFGPHLHFEIRKSENELPVNPLLFNLGHTDNIKPIIERVAIYPLSDNSFINNHSSVLKMPVRGGHGRYTLPEEKEVVVSGPVGFGVKLYDLVNGSINKCGAYSIELMIDSITIFSCVMDAFPFNQTRYVNCRIDYESFIKENTYYERTFVLPNDKLGNYRKLVNRGIFNFNDNKNHNIMVKITDADKNTSVLSFTVKSQAERIYNLSLPARRDENLQMMPYDKANKFAAENFSLEIPAGALYDTLYFSYNKKPATPVMLSGLHLVHNRYTPLHRGAVISIKPDSIPPGKAKKMLIVQLNDNMSRRAIISKWDDGSFHLFPEQHTACLHDRSLHTIYHCSSGL